MQRVRIEHVSSVGGTHVMVGPLRESNPFFSVIIPVYNRAHRVRHVLESVKSQTFEHFECLIIDDGSADGEYLAAVVSSLDDARFQYLRQDNHGAASARNLGIDMARGTYIAFLDSDDIFLPQKLDKAAMIIDCTEGDVFIYSQMLFDRGVGKMWIRPQRGALVGERIDEYLFVQRGWILTSSVVLPTSVARQVRFDDSLPSSQDADFVIRVANVGTPMFFVPEPLVIIDDRPSDLRVSKNVNYQPLLDWISRMRGLKVSERSYWAYRGWHAARAVAASNRCYAIGLFLQSLVRGAYPPSKATVIFAQIAIPQPFYQAIANLVVRLRGQT
ncbi:glycosyltransferase family 2 protein [Mycolicibacterium sp.]|uniref:glycosyltransferase family 2 protein n=1 Tax=Mycolicibacterium sp. TaxID=2320850 RepID=UPI001A29A766|nr:glycosyltransferase family 2 protein [Mycolicibacterium sp.]MBJ7336720.1 glycosyltransferase family 2 protein [Mycolicibacterium sp.]